MESQRSGRSGDIVGTFLETVKSARPSAPSRDEQSVAVGSSSGTAATIQSDAEFDVGDHGEREASSSPASAMSTVLVGLTLAGELTLTDLAAELSIPMLTVAELLRKMESSGLIEINGQPGRETVVLTDAGRTVAELSS